MCSPYLLQTMKLSKIQHVILLVSVGKIKAFSSDTNKAFTGVRFSLYPNVAKEDPPSLKQAVKSAVAGLGDLGLEVRPDDVSSCMIGPEPALFEALRACFAKACVTPDGNPRGVSMQCTFSAGCPGEDADQIVPPPRIVTASQGNEFIDAAYLQPPRIAAQFSVYPMGSLTYMDTIHEVIQYAKTSQSWKEGKSHFCSFLDGDGNEVFDVLRSSFALARKSAGHVVMTATLTANKNAWPEEDRSHRKIEPYES
jgi:energy-coupling factor transport system substrate-specific component